MPVERVLSQAWRRVSARCLATTRHVAKDPFGRLKAFQGKQPDWTPRTLKYARFKDGIFSSLYPPVKAPADLDISAFMFDYRPPSRPDPSGHAWFIDPEDGREIKFEECQQRTTSFAQVLQHRYRFQKDDVLFIFSPNFLDYGTACWGAFHVGGIATTSNPAYTATELLFQLHAVSKNYRIKALLVDPAVLSVAQEALEKAGLADDLLLLTHREEASPYPALDDLLQASKALPPATRAVVDPSQQVAFLSFSSGTTGLPKAVTITHASVISNVLQFTESWKDGRLPAVDSRTLAALPFFHIYGLICLLHFSLYRLSPLVILPKFGIRRLIDLVTDHRISHLWLVPPMAVLLAKHPEVAKTDLSHVQSCVIGAAPFSQRTTDAFKQAIPSCHIGQGYGLTETCVVVSCFPQKEEPEDFPGDSSGVLISSVEAKIVDPDGKPLGVGQAGEIWSRSPSNATGYLDDPASTRATWDEDGFVHTGDEGFFDEDGALYITDRTKELIKTKAMQVAPAELENLLLQMEEVDDACVVAKQDAYMGEAPWAFVVLSSAAQEDVNLGAAKETATKSKIRQHVAQQTAAFKHLHGVTFIDAIPRNAAGKVLRRVLKKALNNA